jgi:hypothetical protein
LGALNSLGNSLVHQHLQEESANCKCSNNIVTFLGRT